MEIGGISNKDAKLRIEVVKIESTGDSARFVPNKIYGDTNALEVQYNPDSLSMSFLQKVASQKNVGKNDNSQTVTGKDDDNISFSLIFDTSMDRTKQGKYLNVNNKYINKIRALIKGKEEDEDILCKVSWGSIISFYGILSSIKVNYTMFSSDGVPIRAKAEVSFLQLSEPDKPTFSSNDDTDNKKRVELNAGEYLGLLAALEYGNPDKWKSVASANNIDNPRLLQSGMPINLP